MNVQSLAVQLNWPRQRRQRQRRTASSYYISISLLLRGRKATWQPKVCRWLLLASICCFSRKNAKIYFLILIRTDWDMHFYATVIFLETLLRWLIQKRTILGKKILEETCPTRLWQLAEFRLFIPLWLVRAQFGFMNWSPSWIALHTTPIEQDAESWDLTRRFGWPTLHTGQFVVNTIKLMNSQHSQMGSGTEKRCSHNLQSGHPAWWSAGNRCFSQTKY